MSLCLFHFSGCCNKETPLPANLKHSDCLPTTPQTNTTRDTSQMKHSCVFWIFLIILTNMCICLPITTAAADTNNYTAATATKCTVVTAADFGKFHLDFQPLNFAESFLCTFVCSSPYCLHTITSSNNWSINFQRTLQEKYFAIVFVQPLPPNWSNGEVHPIASDLRSSRLSVSNKG